MRIIIISILIFLVAAVVHYLSLAQSEFANGWDGYYYVMQAQSWIDYGHLQSIDYSLIYPYYILLSYIISDYVLAFQLGTALLSATFSVSIFFIVYDAFNKKLSLAFLAAILTIMSPGIVFYISQFPKNLLGIIFLTWVLYFIYKRQIWKMVLMTIFCLLSHRLSAGLAIIALAVYFTQFINWKWLLIAVIGITVLTFLPGLLHISDLTRFNGAFTKEWQFMPLEFLNSGITGDHLLWSIEVWTMVFIMLIYLITIAFHIIKNHEIDPLKVLSIILMVIIFMPFFKFTLGSMGYRFFLLVFFGYPVLVVFLIRNWSRKLVWGISSALILLVPVSMQAYQPAIHDAPNTLYFKVADQIETHYNVHQYPLIIAHKSLAEVIIFHTDFDALNWAPEIESNLDAVARVVHGIPQRYLKNYTEVLHRGDYLRINHQYALMSENSWKLLLEKAGEKQDTTLLKLIENGNNPMQIRPAFIKKGKN